VDPVSTSRPDQPSLSPWRGEAFEAVATAYREALRVAERLWRLTRRSVRAGAATRARLERELDCAEERLELARAALVEHTRRVARDPMRTHVRRLGLGAPSDSTAA